MRSKTQILRLVDLARIGHRQTTIHYVLEYDWIQSLPDCPGWSAKGQQIHQERPIHRVSHWQPRQEMYANSMSGLCLYRIRC